MTDYDTEDFDHLVNSQHLLFRAPQRSDSINLLDKYLSFLKDRTICTIISVRPEKGRISIDAIRRLKPVLNLDSSDNDTVIAIYDSQTMTHEAQSSLLKILEETPQTTRLLFAGDYKTPLLPTILSRLQVVNTTPKKSSDIDSSKQMLYRASGFSSSQLNTFNNDDTAVAEARAWVSSSAIKRLAINQRYTEAEEALKLIRSVQLLLYGTILNKLASADKKTLVSLLNKLDSTSSTIDNLQLSGNVRLNLATLALKI